jgi:hypothetical protein
MIEGTRVRSESDYKGNSEHHAPPAVKPIKSEQECKMIELVCSQTYVFRIEAVKLLGGKGKLAAFIRKYSYRLAIWESKAMLGAYKRLDQYLIDLINAYRGIK